MSLQSSFEYLGMLVDEDVQMYEFEGNALKTEMRSLARFDERDSEDIDIQENGNSQNSSSGSTGKNIIFSNFTLT